MWQHLLLLCALQRVESIRLVSIQVPERVSAGDRVRLSCIYDLEGDKLYSIKWYREGVEFFRFVPNQKESKLYFSMQGIEVDKEKSGNGTVYIQDVVTNISGNYRCEISADAPLFQTLEAEGSMKVEEAVDQSSGVCQSANSHPFLVTVLWALTSLAAYELLMNFDLKRSLLNPNLPVK